MAPPSAAALSLPDVDDEEVDADRDEAWEAELDRRIADVREGRVETVAWEDVQVKIEAILGPRPGRVAVR